MSKHVIKDTKVGCQMSPVLGKELSGESIRFHPKHYGELYQRNQGNFFQKWDLAQL